MKEAAWLKIMGWLKFKMKKLLIDCDIIIKKTKLNSKIKHH